MAHFVICKICNERFDRDKTQAVKISARRYAHQRCFPQGELIPMSSADLDLADLEEYIKILLGEECVGARVKKQIKDFREEYGYSYSGMKKALVYFYEVKGNPKEKANGGIGIVPFIYKDAYNYYLNLFLASNQNKGVNIKEITSRVKEITIKLPKVITPPKKMFNLEDDSEEEEIDDEQ